ncbi:hypothetical protein MJO28_003991 [Puccinia striiformis f. sp. tritici]|uniref:Uncharacterized protein n=1 Tax=Puccinia striiformis f. sp. tritici TaxID=168172 RepID=A0ACC0ENJ7_9BASI|nr:hypothetical protein MJO28_003991 [Puccinia striiformis f. sp. tritici]
MSEKWCRNNAFIAKGSSETINGKRVGTLGAKQRLLSKYELEKKQCQDRRYHRDEQVVIVIAQKVGSGPVYVVPPCVRLGTKSLLFSVMILRGTQPAQATQMFFPHPIINLSSSAIFFYSYNLLTSIYYDTSGLWDPQSCTNIRSDLNPRISDASAPPVFATFIVLQIVQRQRQYYKSSSRWK